MTIQELKDKNLILFECVSGSRAYGTDLPESDTDIKGVFYLPKAQFYGLADLPQVSSEKNDETYYEVGRLAELLLKSNPGVLEMLASPADCIRYCHPLFEPFLRENFCNKLCKDSFAGFAFAQIKRARGLNKKINLPEAPVRKTPLDFCYVSEKQGSVSLLSWLEKRGWHQENCGLVVIPNMRDLYGLYHDAAGDKGYAGVLRKEQANEVALSSVPKGEIPSALMSFNKDAYSMHCRDYKEYQAWIQNRNEARYQRTLAHGKQYDAKNMMHTIRLLDVVAEILEQGSIQVRRPNREFLLMVRNGAYTYEKLMEMAEERLERVERLYLTSTLPELPDKVRIEAMLVEIRTKLYL